MALIRLTKEFKFEMAHALEGYDGPCKHIHGHSYTFSVTILGTPIEDPSSAKLGMVMDFGDLKKIVKRLIVDVFDHALVLRESTASKVLKDNSAFFDKLILVPYQPSSENLLVDFAARIRGELPSEVKLYSLKLRETVTSLAEWYASDND
jgi:6-pyruvoyltetrahydropterin/6-carboxytetrahydropterin synthase